MILSQLTGAASVGVLLFLSLLAYSKKSTTPNGYRFLSLLFLTIALVLVDELLDRLQVYRSTPSLVIIFQPLLYVFGPLIFLATTYLTTAGKKISVKTFLHFIPYLLLFALYVFAYLFKDQENTSTTDSDTRLVEVGLLSFYFVQVCFYLLFSIRQLKKHQLTLPLFVSDLPGNDYHWLYRVIIGLSLLSIISFVELIFDQAQISFYFSFLYLILFYYVGIQIAKQKEVFPFTRDQMDGVSDVINEAETEIKIEAKIEPPSIRKTVITEDRIVDYKERLTILMEGERPYLQSDITLPKLAELLQLTTYQTSYLINTCFDENFYTFINRHRIENCKQMFTDPKYAHLSILGIAFESGFNSKTAFNTAFKKGTGLSPKEFIEQHNKEVPIYQPTENQ